MTTAAHEPMHDHEEPDSCEPVDAGTWGALYRLHLDWLGDAFAADIAATDLRNDVNPERGRPARAQYTLQGATFVGWALRDSGTVRGSLERITARFMSDFARLKRRSRATVENGYSRSIGLDGPAGSVPFSPCWRAWHPMSGIAREVRR
jgi:hypothetical protein